MLQETYDFLKTVCTDLHITKGDFDEAGSKYPDDKVSSKIAYLKEHPQPDSLSIPYPCHARLH